MCREQERALTSQGRLLAHDVHALKAGVFIILVLVHIAAAGAATAATACNNSRKEGTWVGWAALRQSAGL
jgi:hypothetical protein